MEKSKRIKVAKKWAVTVALRLLYMYGLKKEMKRVYVSFIKSSLIKVMKAAFVL